MLRLVGPLTEGSHPRCPDVGIYCIGVGAVVVAVADDYVAAAVDVDGKLLLWCAQFPIFCTIPLRVCS